MAHYNRKHEHFSLENGRDIMIAMGKIIVKEDAAEKATKDSETATKKKAKSTVKPGSELVLATPQAVAKVEKAGAKKGDTKKADIEKVDAEKASTKKSSKPTTAKNTTTKSASAKEATIKVVDLGGEEKAEASEAMAEKVGAETSALAVIEKAGPEKVQTAKKPKAKSVSGMIDDVKPSAKKTTEKPTEEADEPKSDAESAEANLAGEPKYSKGKSALIGMAVALIVAVVGFVGIWFFSQGPKESCIVRFESNGGSLVNGTEMICGKSLAQPSDPVKEGFEFKGWFYEGEPFDFANGRVEADMILVAQWEARDGTETVRVRFDTQGGSAIESFTIKKGILLNPPLTPTKTGYVFAGWYLDDERFDFTQPVNEDITLVAHWREAPKEPEKNGGSNNNQQGSGGSSSSPRPTCDPLRISESGEGRLSDLKVGDTLALSPYLGYVSTADCRAVYRSSNEDIAKVVDDNKSLLGVKAGDVVLSICLTELAGGKELDCVKLSIKVVEEEKEPESVPVTGVEIRVGGRKEESLELELGGTLVLTAVVMPREANNKAVSWSSDNPQVVSVSPRGNSADIKAEGVGTATIKVTVDGNHTATLIVTVKEDNPPVVTPCPEGQVRDEESGECKPESQTPPPAEDCNDDETCGKEDQQGE